MSTDTIADAVLAREDVARFLEGSHGLTSDAARTRVMAYLESETVGNRVLPILDAAIDELFDAATVEAHDVIVMLAPWNVSA